LLVHLDQVEGSGEVASRRSRFFPLFAWLDHKIVETGRVAILLFPADIRPGDHLGKCRLKAQVDRNADAGE
jgi:hypothetical protein